MSQPGDPAHASARSRLPRTPPIEAGKAPSALSASSRATTDPIWSRADMVTSGGLWVPATTAPRNCASTDATGRSAFHPAIRPSSVSPRRLRR